MLPNQDSHTRTKIVEDQLPLLHRDEEEPSVAVVGPRAIRLNKHAAKKQERGAGCRGKAQLAAVRRSRARRQRLRK